MSKQITMSHEEYLAMQDEIAKLKEANSALCQGAPILEINKFTYQPIVPTSLWRSSFSDIEDSKDLMHVAGNFIAKGKSAGVEFEGAEDLLRALAKGVEQIKHYRNKNERIELLEMKIERIKRRNLWQRIINE